MTIDLSTGESSKSGTNVVVSGLVGATMIGIGAALGPATIVGGVLCGIGAMLFGGSVQGNSGNNGGMPSGKSLRW